MFVRDELQELDASECLDQAPHGSVEQGCWGVYSGQGGRQVWSIGLMAGVRTMIASGLELLAGVLWMRVAGWCADEGCSLACRLGMLVGALTRVAGRVLLAAVQRGLLAGVRSRVAGGCAE